MNKLINKHSRDAQMLEGGGAGAGGASAARGVKARPKPPSETAAQEAREAQARAARDAAFKSAKERTEGGVKKTEYPYVDPKAAGDIRTYANPSPSSKRPPKLSDETRDYEGYKKGGVVKGNGVASRTKKCKFI